MDMVVLIVAAVLVAVAQGLVIIHTKPRPHGVLEHLWVAIPALGIILLLVLAFAQVVE